MFPWWIEHFSILWKVNASFHWALSRCRSWTVGQKLKKTLDNPPLPITLTGPGVVKLWYRWITHPSHSWLRERETGWSSNVGLWRQKHPLNLLGNKHLPNLTLEKIDLQIYHWVFDVCFFVWLFVFLKNCVLSQGSQKFSTVFRVFSGGLNISLMIWLDEVAIFFYFLGEEQCYS